MLTQVSKRVFIGSFIGATIFTTQVFAQGLSGDYRVDGRNPDGSEYSGKLRIVDSGGSTALHWEVGTSNYTGQGIVQGQVMTVNWGAYSPVVYVIMGNGSLHGTWANGRALELATPLK